VLESPLSHAEIILADWKGAALIAELAKPQTCGNSAIKYLGFRKRRYSYFVSLLLSTEMLSEVKEDGKVQEDKNETLVSWEFHDLLFHSRSRKGRHSNPSGKTFRFLEKIEQPPRVKPKVSDELLSYISQISKNSKNWIIHLLLFWKREVNQELQR
jgi:hypothetical protein